MHKSYFWPWASEGFFPGGAKSGEICFLALEIEKETFFANNFKIQGEGKVPLPPLPTPMVLTTNSEKLN